MSKGEEENLMKKDEMIGNAFGKLYLTFIFRFNFLYFNWKGIKKDLIMKLIRFSKLIIEWMNVNN